MKCSGFSGIEHRKAAGKSFRFEELNPEYVLPKHQGILVPYLDILKKDLEDREE